MHRLPTGSLIAALADNPLEDSWNARSSLEGARDLQVPLIIVDEAPGSILGKEVFGTHGRSQRIHHIPGSALICAPPHVPITISAQGDEIL